MQTQLTNSLVQIQIAENEAEAQLARARKQAEQVVVTAQAESQQRILAGRGEGARILQEGLSEASVLLRKIQSFSDPRLYALSIVAQNLAQCTQPLVPERVFIAGGGGSNGHGGDGLPAGLAAPRPAAGCWACCSACWSPRSPASTSRACPAATCSRTSPTRSRRTPWRISSRPWPPDRARRPTAANVNLNLEVADPAKPAAPTGPTTAKVDRPAGETTVVAAKA